MTSAKYIGYLGGAAVAAGVGAAIAVAGAASANAESADGEAAAAPAKAEAKPDHPKPLEKLTDRIEKVAAQVTKKASAKQTPPSTSKPDDANISATQITIRRPPPTPQEFEAEQVERLKGLFQGQAATPAAAKAGDDAVTAAEAVPYDPNPFRQNDPAPVDIPAPVVAVRDQLVGATPEGLAPYVREGVEQAYRGSQMVPWVNAVVPVTKIVPSVGAALDGDKDARQLIVNELIKTTPPGSFLYYGYDLVADLANREDEAKALKEQAFTGVWDLLDPTGVVHPPGKPGI